ncbi:MAG: hypothetical protein ACR2KL_00500 [Nocardioidaceae bacterium]
MSDLAPLLQGFFTDKLIRQRQASRTPSPPTATPSHCCSASFTSPPDGSRPR